MTPKESTIVTAEAPAASATLLDLLQRCPRAFGHEEIDVTAGSLGGGYLLRSFVQKLLSALPIEVLLVMLADPVPDHDVADPGVQRMLDAPRNPIHVKVQRQVATHNRSYRLPPARHRQKELRSLEAGERVRLGDADLVVHGKGHIGALFAVPECDVVELYRVRRWGDAVGEVVRTDGPTVSVPGLVHRTLQTWSSRSMACSESSLLYCGHWRSPAATQRCTASA